MTTSPTIEQRAAAVFKRMGETPWSLHCLVRDNPTHETFIAAVKRYLCSKGISPQITLYPDGNAKVNLFIDDGAESRTVEHETHYQNRADRAEAEAILTAFCTAFELIESEVNDEYI